MIDSRVPSRLSDSERACLSFLAGTRAPVPCGDLGWETAIDRLAREHLTPLAERLLLTDAGMSPDDPLLDRYHRHAQALALHTLAVEAAAKPYLVRLGERGIPYVVVKGPSVARFYRFPGDRPYTDIDLLVPPKHFAAACGVAVESGFSREPSDLQPWPFFDRWCLEGVNLHGPALANIDIHHHLAPWALSGRLRAEDLIDRSDEGTLLSVPVRLAAVQDGLIIACLHMLSDLWKQQSSAMSLCDVVVLRRRLDDTAALARFREADLVWLYDLTMAQLSDTLPFRSDSGPVTTSIRTHTRLRVLGWYGPIVQVRHPVSWVFRLPVPRALLFALGSLFPSPRYVRAKHGSYLRYWWTGLRTLTNGNRRSRPHAMNVAESRSSPGDSKGRRRRRLRHHSP